MGPVDFTLISQRFVEQLPLCLVGGTGVVILAWVLLRVTARHNPGMRFYVWFSSLLAIAALLMLGGMHRKSTAIVSPHATQHALFELPAVFAVYAFIAWVAIAGAALLQIAAGLWQVYRLRKSCIEVDPDALDPRLRECLEPHAARRVALCVSECVSVPTAIGFNRPAVVMPTWTMKELSTADLKQILLHEVAHLRRWDDWTNLGQKILRSLLFFHPLAWWVENRLTLEREMACDDAVLRHTENPGAYARCLATLAEKSFARRSVALAQAAVSRMQQTTLRVSRILHLQRHAATRRWAPAVSLLAVFSLVGVLLAHAPRLIGFEDNTPRPLHVSAAARTAPHLERIATHTLSSPRPQAPRDVAHHTTDASTPAAAAGKRTDLARTTPPNINSQPQPDVVPAAYVPADRHPRTRTPLRAQSAEVLEQTATVEQTVFVVMEGQQADAPAVTLWQVTVWRLTLSPAGSPARRELTAKKI